MKKRFCFTLFAAVSIAAAFNVHSIKADAATLYPSNEYIEDGKLKVGDLVIDDEDSEPLFYRVVKTASKKNKKIEIEVAGINQNYDWSQKNPKYFDRNNLYIMLDSEDMEEYAPYKIIGIADNAFKDDKTIRHFSIGGTNVQYVGISAFEGCTNLQYFSSNEKITTIKDRAFYNCKSLNNFYLTEDTLKSVGTDALRNTSPIIRIDTYKMSTKHASKINKLFKKAGAQKVYFKIEEPKKESKKKRLPDESDVMLKLPKGAAFTSGEFSYKVIKPATKKHRGEVEITGFSPSATPGEMEGVDPMSYVDGIGYERYDIVGIANNAFKDNQNITSIMLYEGNIRYIGKSAFEGCSNIKNVYITRAENFSKIKTRAFFNCSSLKELSISEGKLSRIGKDAFGGTPQKMKVEVRDMNSRQFSKLKQLMKKAGAQKTRFKKVS
ncbi:leucine-rich repeat domain-containing protein [Butyrivibrio sp. FC2001]|uniref:leucine-rich repeat domain-containing protein n=1 Tax=Butyrivibrio sp. FC2001 TaxID=1280671 RepID=UPI0004084FC9|nr:leucine-rich repeat domain-containing protein [Butyrivibrio sp. FC2001]